MTIKLPGICALNCTALHVADPRTCSVHVSLYKYFVIARTVFVSVSHSSYKLFIKAANNTLLIMILGNETKTAHS